MTEAQKNTGIRVGLLLITAGGYMVGGWTGVGWVALVLGVVSVLGACVQPKKRADSFDTWSRAKMECLRKQEQKRDSVQ